MKKGAAQRACALLAALALCTTLGTGVFAEAAPGPAESPAASGVESAAQTQGQGQSGAGSEEAADSALSHQPEFPADESSLTEEGTQAAGDAEAYLFGVCDQPYLRAWTLGRLTERYQLGPERIAAVRSGSRMGNPNIFSARYRQELLELSGDTGGKAVMRRHPEDVAFVEAGERELVDLDVRP